MTATQAAPTDARTQAWRRWLRSLLSEPGQQTAERQESPDQPPPSASADPPALDRRAGD